MSEYERVNVDVPMDVDPEGHLIPSAQELQPAPELKDQTDTPHVAGIVVHRRSGDGRWYIRRGPCSSNHFARPACATVGYELVEDYLDDTESHPSCLPCWQATSEER